MGFNSGFKGLTHVIPNHYKVFSWCVSCTKRTNRYLCQGHVL